MFKFPVFFTNQDFNVKVEIFSSKEAFLKAGVENNLINSIDSKIFKETTSTFFLKNEIFYGLLFEKEITNLNLRKLGVRIAKRIKESSVESNIKILFQCDQEINFSYIYEGFVQKMYSFDKYITEKKDKLQSINEIYLLSNKYQNQTDINKDLLNAKQILESVYILKNFVNEPPNVIYPSSYANEIIKLFQDSNCTVKVFDEQQLKEMNANLILAVGQGSKKPPRMVVIEYFGNKESNEVDVTLIGKGITFDSGGMSLKPSGSMETMKSDMAGSACVVSQLLLLSKQKIKVNVIGVIALAENMLDGNAICVSSVIKSMSGLSVEILDTDAEGRLVLADALYYASTTYKPKHIIDLATLTGAIVVALGEHYAGLFSNDEKLIAKLEKIGKETDDKCWNMPMGEEYLKTMKSTIADLKNISSVRREAGSTTAACFLEKFINEHKSWAHLDIAGVAYHERSVNEFDDIGASGFGIRLLNDFIKTIEK